MTGHPDAGQRPDHGPQERVLVPLRIAARDRDRHPQDVTVGVLVAEPAFARSAVAIASSSDLSLVGLGLLGLVLGQRAGGERA